MTSIAVVFQSERGHTKSLADSVVKGIASVEGVTAKQYQIRGKDVNEGRFANPGSMTELDHCDGIVFGCATYMGSGSAVFKSFLEAAFRPHWFEQRWTDKIAAGFTNSASQSGDKLSTLLQLAVFAMQMGMIWIGVSDLPGNNWSAARAPTSIDSAPGLALWVRATPMSRAQVLAISMPRNVLGAASR
jgi:multimeric flavodoxin WrbA